MSLRDRQARHPSDQSAEISESMIYLTPRDVVPETAGGL